MQSSPINVSTAWSMFMPLDLAEASTTQWYMNPAAATYHQCVDSFSGRCISDNGKKRPVQACCKLDLQLILTGRVIFVGSCGHARQPHVMFV